MKNSLKSLILFLFACLLLTGCKTDEIDTYGSKRALFFPNLHPNDNKIIIDSIFVSFSHHPGVDELEIPFRVSLIGPLLESDLEYSVSVIDETTTATTKDYELPEKFIFRKGMVHDSLWIKIKRENLGDREALLAFKVVENKNFTVGFYDRQIAKLAFNDIISQPKWWDKEIITNFFGEYSYKKYTTIILAAKEYGIEFNSTEGMFHWQIRKIGLIAKDYIRANGITEEDGSEMIIIVY